MVKLVRFADLKSANIVQSWAQLKELQQRDAFPTGFMLSKNARCWFEAEVLAWLAARPTQGPPLRGAAAKLKAGNRRKAAAQPPAATEV
jgi:hypothetical protein